MRDDHEQRDSEETRSEPLDRATHEQHRDRESDGLDRHTDCEEQDPNPKGQSWAPRIRPMSPEHHADDARDEWCAEDKCVEREPGESLRDRWQRGGYGENLEPAQ
jgi:hypothetical protein